jgi:hypothetical protein
LKDHLCSLKDVDPKMRTELRTFFADLRSELSKIVPPPLAALGKVAARQAVISDWAKIQKDVLGTAFSQLGAE